MEGGYMVRIILITVTLISFLFKPTLAKKEIYFKGTIYQDLLGISTAESDGYHRLSTRLKLTLWNKPGDGLTASLDVRDRFKLGDAGANQLIIYDMKLDYDKPGSQFFLSLGQMHVYDTAGIGELAGGLVGMEFKSYFSAGVYYGVKPDIYNAKWDMDYRKMGIFLRYLGPKARQFSIGYHIITFSGETERKFLYGNLLYPLKKFTLYGCAEYELSSATLSEDRLSHAFFNSRINIHKYVDITCHLSLGRGLDYHQFLLENSQNPNLLNEKIDRFYYSQTYGARITVKPKPNLRFFLSQRESEHKDKEIKNHTTQLGASISNISNTGISLYGFYNMNNGETSDSDSFAVTGSRSFGKLSLSAGYSNFFSRIQTDPQGNPELVYKTNQHTFSADLFYIVNRSLALFIQYAYTLDSEVNSNLYSIRIIYRKRPK